MTLGQFILMDFFAQENAQGGLDAGTISFCALPAQEDS